MHRHTSTRRRGNRQEASGTELAVVIGSTPDTASAEAAGRSIFGYTVFNDVTSLSILATGDIFLSKSVDGFSAFGLWIRTDVSDQALRDGLAIVSRVNGVEAQRGTTAVYKWSPAEVVFAIGKFVALFPGDVISLGTPPPGAEVHVGDAVECEVEEIRVLANHIA
ncbi:MAG TPA: fumarylacetoacetate hydrolase family protein [Acidimicrobiales bacterium]